MWSRALMSAVLGAAVLVGTAHAAEHEVVQKDKKFSRATLEAAVGDTIRVVNQDDVVHNVFSLSRGYEFDMGFQSPGAAASILLKHAGTAELRCAIHPRMKVKVTVR